MCPWTVMHTLHSHTHTLTNSQLQCHPSPMTHSTMDNSNGMSILSLSLTYIHTHAHTHTHTHTLTKGVQTRACTNKPHGTQTHARVIQHDDKPNRGPHYPCRGYECETDSNINYRLFCLWFPLLFIDVVSILMCYQSISISILISIRSSVCHEYFFITNILMICLLC